ncbi:MAG: orotidine-5'-phosphate decarboxylase [Candidatus Omnitrophica bacterium]|nr:orotidine-5'-phosphate decarboxylase [Candidatus Omnitrophota bacterium]MCF7891934.1 orotidine-5'-phosphate decarboxylase [Candidatus Omnitrophota bacterium]MCF7896199.1 orotidine-5'-phosphate decarboxylase [Candidatus Omnitrophota bacterium]MCF7897447.1 orotidine-5'-phosphate decarboxylase [Candidatus Omnitrophota bacterium]MCF7909375.1 orotidine-5'-phosphate decarboxylase [Candidatus Omnitrophota bacterium]
MVDLWPGLVVALDLDSEEKIKSIVEQLTPKVKKFKIGPVAYTRFGPEAINWVCKKGADVFLDFKLYDIPNTMIETAKAFVDLGIWAFTVHLKAGRESISMLTDQVADYAKENNKRAPLAFGVTELTSKEASLEQILNLAKEGKEAGIQGIVCSVWEAKTIKEETGLLAITPGIRITSQQAGKGVSSDDQKRIASLADAVKAGSDYFVVGRPIVKSHNPFLAAENLVKSAL